MRTSPITSPTIRDGPVRRSVLASVVTLLVVALLGCGAQSAQAQLFGGTSPAVDGSAQFRGLWVDAYHDGAKTPKQIDKLVADARRANVNALVVQVRRRGDAYYAKSLEPRTDDPSLAAGFDALQYLIDKAHSGSPRLEVHAWISALPIWGEQDRSPGDARHVFNRHGPSAAGSENWLMRRADGETWATGYFLDPGHPDAARYTAEVALNLVREYDVDGLHLDYIRYPDVGSKASWGYNETSVARFNARHGRQGQPAPTDPQWSQWRRDQVTALVRQIYLGTMVLKPQVKVSAAVIPWGAGPKTDADWIKTSAYGVVFQDWRAWLEEGILDLAMPMTYYHESDANQQGWFDSWVSWQRDHAYGRQIVPAVALYMNSPSQSIDQIKRALAPGANGARVAGVALYSYAVPRKEGSDGAGSSDGQAVDVWAALSAASPANGGTPPFPGASGVPAMAWKASPQGGGIVVRVPGLDGARVDVTGPAGFGGETDGNGLYGLAVAPPGTYSITVKHRSLPEPRTAQLELASGAVAELELR
jgi:uncharacterized lipoprotein YddW (UPF0748 family)